MKRWGWAAAMAGLAIASAGAAADLPAPDWGRIELVHAELFGVDASHSYVGFTIGFMGLTKVRGSFRNFNGAILYDEKEPSLSSVTLVIETGSIDTGMDIRDKDLKSPRFFDAEKYPKIVFRSRSIEKAGRDRYTVRGTLQMRGVEREIVLPMAQTVARMPDKGWGNMRVGASGAMVLKRTDYGILGDSFWGEKALTDEVEVEISILGTRSNFERWSFDSRAKPSVGAEMWKALEVSGAAAAVARYRELKEKSPEDYNFSADQVGLVGNRLLQHRRLKEALEVFQLAAAEAPREAAFSNRIGEIEAALGDRDSAVAAYRKALELSAGNPEAIEMLKRLEPPGPAR